jgi:hypothetical protein
MEPIFRVEPIDPANADIVAKGGDPLRALCRKEAEAFSQWLRENEPNFPDGFFEWERQALHVYLYKKARGLDEFAAKATGDLPPGEQDGAA